MGAVLTIAHLTWTEARRRRIALAAVLCGLAFLAVFGTAIHFILQNGAAHSNARPLFLRQMQLEFLTLAGLYVVNFLTIAMAVLLPVDTLSGEIASGVMQTLACKPIHRAQILLGKWLAYLGILVSYLVLMSLGIVLTMKLQAGFSQAHLASALPLMALESAVLLTITLAGGTRFTTVTNGIVAFAFYAVGFIGGWVEQIGAFTGSDAARYIGTSVSLVSPTDVLWRLAAHHLMPPMMTQLQLSPFSSFSVPSPAMVVWAVAFVLAALSVALASFQRRPL